MPVFWCLKQEFIGSNQADSYSKHGFDAFVPQNPLQSLKKPILK